MCTYYEINLTIIKFRGLCDSGAKAITIHGRTRGSPKFRRAGPADLRLVKEIATAIFNEKRIPLVSNGNVRCCHEGALALQSTSPCIGIMSAEGALRDPAIFLNISNSGCTDVGNLNTCASNCDFEGEYDCDRCRNELASGIRPDLYSIFAEYCHLSELYRLNQGWNGMDEMEAAKLGESKQIYIARQHLTWILGKTGRGRTIRYKHLGSSYLKHYHLLNDINASKTMTDLLIIAEKCLKNI
jgi:tRNA-dihydrouridine synthase